MKVASGGTLRGLGSMTGTSCYYILWFNIVDIMWARIRTYCCLDGEQREPL